MEQLLRLALPAAFAATILLVGISLVGVRPLQAADIPPAGTSILARAMSDVGSFQGECFPWVRRVVSATTGRLIGWGYREGYLAAGATEVALDQVQAGDVIQVVADWDTSPLASYPGLHTSIATGPMQAGGVVPVVDSNSQWDGVVRVRHDYNPQTAAARYGLQVYVYRFSDVSATSPTEGTAIAALTPGTTARVRDDGSCLNLRALPTTAGTIIRCLAQNSTVTVLDGTAFADGYEWVRVQAGSDTGWVASQFLVEVPATPPPTAPPASTPTPAPPSTPAPPAASVSGTIRGSLPTGGGPGLVVWGGGPVQSVATAASSGGCLLRSVWSTVGGAYVSYTHGAPSFVNGTWSAHYPGDLPVMMPLILVCAPGGTSPITSPPEDSSPEAAWPSLPPGSISGGLPTSGGAGLVVWSGGPVQSVATAASSGGCALRSIWSTVDGAYVGYTHGAPSFVNSAWSGHYPGDLAAITPLILLCGGGSPPASTPPVAQPPASAPPSSGPVGTSPAPPSSDDRPPGPAGNEG